MKQYVSKKILTCLLGAVLLVLALCVILPQGAKAAELDRYGYTKLDSDAQKKIYVEIVNALSARQDELSLSDKNFSEKDLTAAADMVRRDYPEFFYYSQYNYSVNSSGIVQSVEFSYVLNGKAVKGDSAELKAACAALDQKVNEILKGAKGDDYQKALYLHDYIVDHLIYKSSSNDQTAYGALIEERAVCAGYSHAYQLLLRKAGIESFYITGNSKGVAHAWLLVFLEGDCYYTDVTWDDPKTADDTPIRSHYYFDMSYDQISKDHTHDPEYKNWLPKKHNHKDMYYFEHDAAAGSGVGKFNNTTAPEKLFEYMKKDGNKYYCEFVYDGGDFDSWFNDALQNVANQVGEIAISYVPIEDEYILTITARAAEHELKKVAAKAPTCTSDGNKEHYECKKCGKRFSDATAKTWLSNDSCVIIERLSHNDANRDNRCDTCNRKMSVSSSTTTTTPPTEVTTPPTEATTPPTEATTPPTEATEATTPSTEATEVTTPSTEATVPSTEATQETTPSSEATEATTPSTEAIPDATVPVLNEPSDNGNDPADNQWTTIAIGAAAAVVVLAVVLSIVRKKRVS